MTASPSAPPADPLVAALNASYAAVFAYGLAGAHLPEARRPFALQALAEHRAGRDWLRARIAESGGEPPPAVAAYDTGTVTTPEQAAALAAEVELALVPRWAAATGAVPSPQRPYCTAQAQGCAVRAFLWGAAPAAFPGAVDSAATGGVASSATGESTPTPTMTPTTLPTPGTSESLSP